MFCIQNTHQAQSGKQKQPERSTSIPDVQTFGDKASHERTLSGVLPVILSAAKDDRHSLQTFAGCAAGSSALDRARRTPKGTWIDEIWVEGEHLVIEFTRGCRFMVQTYEIPNVLLCRCKMLRTIGIFVILMDRNNCTWVQGLNALKGRDPIEATVFACLSHVRMNAIVNRISSHHQTDGWDVKRR